MAELIGGPINDLFPQDVADTTGPSQAQATFGEGVAAAASNAWQDVSMNVFSRSTSALEAAQAHFNKPGDQGSADTQAMEAERGPGPDTTQVTPERANEQIKQQGATLTPFTAPISQGSLDAYIKENLAKQRNADVISRTADGITGGAARFGVGALVSLADPLNDMAMMIPGAPDAWAAEKIAQLGGGVLARAAVRGASGALQGAAGMAALVPFQYAAASQDHEDYGWGDALRQVGFGALLGAGGGALHGVLSRAEPETVEAVAKASLARIMTDDPRGVDIQGLLDHGEATQAADRLERWQALQQRLDTERSAIQPRLEYTGRDGEIAEARVRMENAYEQERQLRGEVGQVSALDEVTQARLDAVQQELSRVIPSARRTALEHEREMLTGGQQGPDVGLETARSQAQVAGLTAAADRARTAAETAEAKIIRLRQQEAQEQAAADAARRSSDRATRIAQLKLDSREMVLQNLMEKQVRTYAYRMGVDLQPGEAATIAREIRTAQPGEVQDTIAAHLNAVGRRSDAPPVRDALSTIAPPPATNGPIAALRTEARGAARDMATRAMNATNPELERADRVAEAMIATAPKLEGELSKDLAEVNTMLADVKGRYMEGVSSGTIAEHPSLADAGKEELDHGNAQSAYAACLGAR